MLFLIFATNFELMRSFRPIGKNTKKTKNTDSGSRFSINTFCFCLLFIMLVNHNYAFEVSKRKHSKTKESKTKQNAMLKVMVPANKLLDNFIHTRMSTHTRTHMHTPISTYTCCAHMTLIGLPVLVYLLV